MGEKAERAKGEIIRTLFIWTRITRYERVRAQRYYHLPASFYLSLRFRQPAGGEAKNRNAIAEDKHRGRGFFDLIFLSLSPSVSPSLSFPPSLSFSAIYSKSELSYWAEALFMFPTL